MAHVLFDCAFLRHFRLRLHNLITFLAVMSLQQQDTQHTQSTLRRFSPAVSLLCIARRSQLNWSPGENLWERSPCSAFQLSAGQRAARRFAWRSIPHCVLKPTVPFRAAAEAVGMQSNLSPFPTRRVATLIYSSLPWLSLYVYFICLDRGQISCGWRGCCQLVGSSPTQHPELMVIGKLIT